MNPKDFLLTLLACLIATVIAGIILYNLYNTAPKLYVDCSIKAIDKMIVSIENSGEPAFSVLMFVNVDGLPFSFLPKNASIGMVGKEKVTEIIDLNYLKENIRKNTNETVFSSHLMLICENCEQKNIIRDPSCDLYLR